MRFYNCIPLKLSERGYGKIFQIINYEDRKTKPKQRKERSKQSRIKKNHGW